SSLKLTVPVGAAPAVAGATVAFNATACPLWIGVTGRESVVVVPIDGGGFIVTRAVDESLVALGSPGPPEIVAVVETSVFAGAEIVATSVSVALLPAERLPTDHSPFE